MSDFEAMFLGLHIFYLWGLIVWLKIYKMDSEEGLPYGNDKIGSSDPNTTKKEHRVLKSLILKR